MTLVPGAKSALSMPVISRRAPLGYEMVRLAFWQATWNLLLARRTSCACCACNLNDCAPDSKYV